MCRFSNCASIYTVAKYRVSYHIDTYIVKEYHKRYFLRRGVKRPDAERVLVRYTRVSQILCPTNGNNRLSSVTKSLTCIQSTWLHSIQLHE